MSETKQMSGFLPCSPKHKSCSRSHSNLVWAYRAERERQQLKMDEITLGYETDQKIYIENFGNLIDFRCWLQMSKRTEK